MALPATDSFTNTNGTSLTAHSASWSVNSGAFAINSNALYSNSEGDHTAHWNADAFNNNQYAQAPIAGLISSVYIGVAVRVAASAETAYTLETDSSDATYFSKFVAGVYTNLGTSAVLAVSDTIRIEANGTTITPLKNGGTSGVPGATTDSSISSGSAGVKGAGSNAGSRIDSWEGGNLGAATTSFPPASRQRLYRRR